MKPSRRVITLVTAIVGLVLLGGSALTLSVPYVTMAPGPTFDTLGKIDDTPMFTYGDDVTTYPTKGRLDFTSVSVTRAESRLTLMDVMGGWLDKDTVVVPHDFVYPDHESNEDADRAGAAQLTSSKDASRAAAMRAAGLTVSETVVVHEVTKNSPADGALKKKDEILAVDGKTVTTTKGAADRIADRTPGDSVTLRISRAGDEREVTVDTVPNEQDPKRPRVGIIVSTSFDFPIEVENHIGDRVGGPSAGMMFALAMYDQITPGPLTGGLHVAGTGSIDPDGRVGIIGGIEQKMAGAEGAGADVFLVPAPNCIDLVDTRKFDMTLVKVETLDDAVSALSDLSSNPKAKVPAC